MLDCAPSIRTCFPSLLAATVRDLQEEIEGLGETIAFDTKHIYAWVKENNKRVYVKDRYDKNRQPAGDPDCKLGVKRRSNQEQPDGTIKEEVESLWGYGSGVVAATVPGYGDVVLAEYTQPFNENDITYYRPLYQKTVIALNHFPLNSTGDAAFDAQVGSMTTWLDMEALPLFRSISMVTQQLNVTLMVFHSAPKDYGCTPNSSFTSAFGYRAERYGCPLLYPERTGEDCDHEQFKKGKGCVKDINIELGGKMRISLDRNGPLYKAIYNQRTCCERINSQSKELGIERPKVRNIRSVRNLNTLTYLIINVRALRRAKSLNSELLPISRFRLGHSKKPCLQ